MDVRFDMYTPAEKAMINMQHKMLTGRARQMGCGAEEEASNVAYEHYVFLLLPVTC